tara:strand:- start:40 stop:306 length:267 start_codon:yes stop_codon:yes gene_type:complete
LSLGYLVFVEKWVIGLLSISFYGGFSTGTFKIKSQKRDGKKWPIILNPFSTINIFKKNGKESWNRMPISFYAHFFQPFILNPKDRSSV